MSELTSVRVWDLDVAFRIEGPRSAPVVMLAHGILASHEMWGDVCELLSPKWRVLRYDLRGHGKTSVTRSPYTLSELAQDAVGLLDALGIEHVHFVGSSLGGMLGQRLGALHPTRIRSLTLANTTAVQGAPQAWTQRMALAVDKGVHALVEPTLQRWFTPGFRSSSPSVVNAMRAIALQTPLDGFLGCASAVRDLSQLSLLRDIGVPTLIVAGEYDEATPGSESRQMARHICDSSLAFLPAAHQSAVECPEAFAGTWTSFASKLPPPVV